MHGLQHPLGSVLQMRPLDWAGRQSLIARFRFQHVYEKNQRNNQIHIRLKLEVELKLVA